MEKEFEINGCVIVLDEITEEEFFDKFIDFVESNNWSFGGGINEVRDNK